MPTLELSEADAPPPAEPSVEKQWSPLRHGLQHYGKLSDAYSATIEERGSAGVDLHKWYPGCDFSPMTHRYGSIGAAREAGKKWVDECTAGIESSIAATEGGAR